MSDAKHWAEIESERMRKGRIRQARRALADLAIEIVSVYDEAAGDPFGNVEAIIHRMRSEVEAIREEREA